jgi:peptide methionine sulfoxide reductase MsrA
MPITPGVQRAHRPCGSRKAALASQARSANALKRAGHGGITTAIREAPASNYAENCHQQYVAKNPNGCCGIGGYGVPFRLAELQVSAKA